MGMCFQRQIHNRHFTSTLVARSCSGADKGMSSVQSVGIKFCCPVLADLAQDLDHKAEAVGLLLEPEGNC